MFLEATSADNMQALLEFMYKGEVHVSQDALSSFLKSGENLQVKSQFNSSDSKYMLRDVGDESLILFPFRNITCSNTGANSKLHVKKV